MTWKLYFDGLCEPYNPGGVMSFGLVLCAPDDELASGAIVAKPENTNNIAEYLGLYEGLRRAVKRREAGGEYPGLLIFGDSQLVCFQVSGKWGNHKEHLRRAQAACAVLLDQLKPWDIKWIPREENGRADALSRKAYIQVTGKQPPERVKRARG